jgi:hypothetical protein
MVFVKRVVLAQQFIVRVRHDNKPSVMRPRHADR